MASSPEVSARTPGSARDDERKQEEKAKIDRTRGHVTRCSTFGFFGPPTPTLRVTYPMRIWLHLVCAAVGNGWNDDYAHSENGGPAGSFLRRLERERRPDEFLALERLECVKPRIHHSPKPPLSSTQIPLINTSQYGNMIRSTIKEVLAQTPSDSCYCGGSLSVQDAREEFAEWHHISTRWRPVGCIKAGTQVEFNSISTFNLIVPVGVVFKVSFAQFVLKVVSESYFIQTDWIPVLSNEPIRSRSRSNLSVEGIVKYSPQSTDSDFSQLMTGSVKYRVEVMGIVEQWGRFDASESWASIIDVSLKDWAMDVREN
ncbi:hypothetical protein R3P38DRAFT_2801193 [Favolaschia claudopus]|uniref:Uncharacterized protein n=1 Tax=Favolaschia claudopus TaxID=2862362 RepID=A0AAV9ZW83_9AGAR